jgi:hypothetical protein
MQGILTFLEERVTLRTLLAVMSGLIVSIFLLYVGPRKSWWIGRKAWQTLLQQVRSSPFTLDSLSYGS